MEGGIDEGKIIEPMVVLEQTPAGPVAHTFYNKIKIVKMTEVEQEMKILYEESLLDPHLDLTTNEIAQLKFKK